jgi:hypothetical protein
MGKVDVQKDLETIKDGVTALLDASKMPKGKGNAGLDAWREQQEKVSDEHLPLMIGAGVRRIADSIEDQAGAG